MSNGTSSSPSAMPPQAATTEVPEAPVDSAFLQQWKKFYSQACILASNDDDNDSASDDPEKKSVSQRVLITMETITKIMFGLDGSKKALLTTHGMGVLELIVSLVKRSIQDDNNNNSDDGQNFKKDIILSSVKAIKSCVVRNPSGRSRCRSAGVFGILGEMLTQECGEEKKSSVDEEDKDPLLLEEIFTTLAAVCLGDDLNALQGSIQMVSYIQNAKTLYPDNKKYNSMHQKLLYLQTLFDTLQKEQSKLLQFLQNNDDDKRSTSLFFSQIVKSEINKRTGDHLYDDKRFNDAQKHYNDAMDLIESYKKQTKLLDSHIAEIQSKRAEALFQLGDLSNCLKDTNSLLEIEDSDARNAILKLHAKALIQMNESCDDDKNGKMIEDAKDLLGKLKILYPQDEEVVELLGTMK